MSTLRFHRMSLGLSLVMFLAIAPARADVLILGDPQSEQSHDLASDHSEIIKGGLDEPARRLLPLGSGDWQGGKVTFTMNVDPAKPNYLTVRFWGSDRAAGILILFCQGKQIGYRHLGDIDVLDIASGSPPCAGRFFYTTSPLPLSMTQGKTSVQLEIRSTGRIWGYGTNWEQYQKPMTDPSRGIYRAYTHTDGCFAPPPDEKQGEAPANAPIRKAPGEEAMASLKMVVANAIRGQLKSKNPLSQMRLNFLAKAYATKWTEAFNNPAVARLVVDGADAYYRNFKKDPRIAQRDPNPESYNNEWLGLGPLGDAIRRLKEPLQPFLDQTIDDGAGQSIVRRTAWSQMLQASRDWHLRNRRQYTNQSMIVDMYSYLANRGIAAIDPAHALPETRMRRYLYESIGLEPWLGSDTDNGPAKPLGTDFWQLTRKGLTRELGFVGYYGEVIDWVTSIYLATAEPGQLGTGDERIKAQLEKIEQARLPFRYPAVDDDGFRAMRIEAIVGWRDPGHYPGDVTYGERSTWDGSPLYSAAATLSPHAIGTAQQLFADNQFFNVVAERAKDRGLRTVTGSLPIPDQYETLKSLPPNACRLPMTPGQGDFSFTDEEDGVLALKRGDEILYVSLYWRARHGINNLARVHHITPRFERIAVVQEETQFEPSGMEYTRPDWVNIGFANGGLKYPGNLHSAHAGEKLPIARIPAGIPFKPGAESPYAGRGSFCRLQYGNYLIGMNSTPGQTFELRLPPGLTAAPDLISAKPLTFTEPLKVPPLSTVVLYLTPERP